jgi:ring-1,2-phenylacetyl-CoA epoxidase subunit PaaC
MIAGLADVWPDVAELAGTDPAEAFDDAMRVVDQVLETAGQDRPDVHSAVGRGRDGIHTESFPALLGELQGLARQHPMGRW